MLKGWKDDVRKRERWNITRDRWLEWCPLLREACLVNEDLREANLYFADLRKSNLVLANLSGAKLSGAQLGGAELWNADLGKADFSGADLDGADIHSADLSGADLRAAGLRGANFGGANLSGTNLCGADLSGANFGGANLSGADLRSAYLHAANLCDANLSGTDLVGAIGMRLDGTDIRGARFSPNADEPWHHVRRGYTGGKFFFHLLLLVIFFGSMGLRTAMWAGVNRAQTAVVNAAQRLDDAAEKTKATHPDLAVAMSEASRELAKVKETFTEDTRTYRIWQVLLGLDRGPWACVLAVLLLVYNAGRGWLTYTVGAMREEEERSGFAPYWKDYKRAWYLHHYVMRWLILIAATSFAYHAYFWLTAKVVLPG